MHMKKGHDEAATEYSDKFGKDTTFCFLHKIPFQFPILFQNKPDIVFY